MKLLLLFAFIPFFLSAQYKSIDSIAKELDELVDDNWFFAAGDNQIDIFYCSACNENYKRSIVIRDHRTFLDSNLLDFNFKRSLVSNPPHPFGDTIRNWNTPEKSKIIHLKIEFDSNYSQSQADEKCDKNRMISDIIWSQQLNKVSREEFKDFRLAVPNARYFDRFLPDSLSTFIEKEPYWPKKEFLGAIFIDMDFGCFLCEDYAFHDQKYVWEINEECLIADDKFELFQLVMDYFGVDDYTYRLSKGSRLNIGFK